MNGRSEALPGQWARHGLIKREKTRTMTPDSMETLGGSTVQHGKCSDRVYLMKLCPQDRGQMVGRLDTLAREKGYSKIFAKVPAPMEEEFLKGGYAVEARVPGLFNGHGEGLFMGKFFTSDRARVENGGLLDQVRAVALSRAGARGAVDSRFRVRPMEPGQAGTMARLYGRVFASYPFPIMDPGFIKETMASHVRYFGVFEGRDLVALSAAEVDMASLSAEMTDFATLPHMRGRGISDVLLSTMGQAVGALGIRTAYTIARATSYGMNIVFARAGYRYGGMLVNNTHIAGALESMNVWWADISD
ncbi:MAG: putative beta-lysine N-acetyltransferase [Desulfobacterium sp.]|nr:putative beta-lysine N-acetyltransferase [Desulfobacterium sp.]